jgi:hypothetical protein
MSQNQNPLTSTPSSAEPNQTTVVSDGDTVIGLKRTSDSAKPNGSPTKGVPRRSMRTAVAATAMVLAGVGASSIPIVQLASPTPTAKEPGKKPGKWRWSVKTLSDLDGKTVIKLRPVSLTVQQASDFVAPDDSPSADSPRGIGPEEKTLYEVTGYVRSFKGEDDGDFHVLLSDNPSDKGPFLGVEIPREDYATGTDKSILDNYKQARSTFEKEISLGSASNSKYTVLTTPRKVSVEGVGFWDEVHGQKGLPTGFEIHPVLRFTLSP